MQGIGGMQGITCSWEGAHFGWCPPAFRPRSPSSFSWEGDVAPTAPGDMYVCMHACVIHFSLLIMCLLQPNTALFFVCAKPVWCWLSVGPVCWLSVGPVLIPVWCWLSDRICWLSDMESYSVFFCVWKKKWGLDMRRRRSRLTSLTGFVRGLVSGS